MGGLQYKIKGRAKPKCQHKFSRTIIQQDGSKKIVPSRFCIYCGELNK